MTTLTTKKPRRAKEDAAASQPADGVTEVRANGKPATGRSANGRQTNGKHANGKHANGGNGKQAEAPVVPRGETAAESPDWRRFVGRWLEAHHCKVEAAPRGDWEVELSPELQRRWRRQRVRLVFDPARPTVPRGAWFTAPGSAGGRRILEAALAEPLCTRPMRCSSRIGFHGRS